MEILFDYIFRFFTSRNITLLHRFYSIEYSGSAHKYCSHSLYRISGLNECDDKIKNSIFELNDLWMD